MKIYIFDPVTFKFIRTVENPVEIPVNSTSTPPVIGAEALQFFVNGQWSFDDPFTPEVEYPVITITGVAISGSTKVGNIWKLKTKQVATLTAKINLPAGTLTAIAETIVRKQPVGDNRFDAEITELVDDPQGNLLTVPLYFENSGNYLISEERLNEGLAEIGQPFRVTFEKVDIDVTVAIPT